MLVLALGVAIVLANDFQTYLRDPLSKGRLVALIQQVHTSNDLGSHLRLVGMGKIK